jgi:hypothetical protein
MSLEERKKALQEQNKAMTKRLALIKSETDKLVIRNEQRAAKLTLEQLANMTPEVRARMEANHQDFLSISKPTANANTVFTEDAAAEARAYLLANLGHLNTGFDPKLMLAGITLAGFHLEKGARTFAAYSKSIRADLGDVIKPYLKSWYLGIKFDPRCATFDGMDSAASVEAVDIDAAEAPTNR